ncbi:MAG TPA: DNA (cytosine-5-)-methyltransferase, partial [Candidatus Dojkabacteria bacterium]|nr:DNA (cytosine-5-)-methyltransferase [Candidatus Dojkabacteria bacterium]
MKYLSTFSGIGGFEIGINKAYEELSNNSRNENRSENNGGVPNNNSELLQGVRQFWSPICIGYSEINKYADQIYKSKFPEHKNYGDITKINAKELPDFDLFVGGFPCQAFSIAGKRGGFDDTRGTLFFDCARILKEKQPRNFILENVKGLLSHDNGRTFATIINTLTELGYCVEWQVLNAKNFGVPQNRERVFIVGHLGGIPKRKVFPIGQNDKENIKSRQVCTSATVSTRTGSTAGGQQFISQLNNPSHSN